MLKNKKCLISVIVIMILCIIFPGCFDKGAKLTKINFLYPDSFYYEPLIGKTLNNWGDVPQGYNLEHDVDNKPREVDLLFTVENQSSVSCENSKVSLEFWIYGTNRIPSDDNLDYDEFLERLHKDSKWFKVWEKEVIVNNLKPHEKRDIKLKNLGLNIRELIDEAPGENNLAIKLKILGTLEKSKVEKVIDFHISY
ncbi:MAG: hypothetical protein K6U80_18825 [Firmicutes bacterium]|nr:hypothetical protein [Bacillota bacterium]